MVNNMKRDVKAGNMERFLKAVYGEPEYVEKLSDVSHFIMEDTDLGGHAHKIYVQVRHWLVFRGLDVGEDLVLGAQVYKNDDLMIRRACTILSGVYRCLQRLCDEFSDEYVAKLCEDYDKESVRAFIKRVRELVWDEVPEELDMYFVERDFEIYSNVASGAFIHRRCWPDALEQLGMNTWYEFYLGHFSPELFRFKDITENELKVITLNAVRFDSSMNRYLRLVQNGAHESLLINEIGMAFEWLYFFVVDPIDKTADFKEFYRLDS